MDVSRYELEVRRDVEVRGVEGRRGVWCHRGEVWRGIYRCAWQRQI